ncbi:MAG: TetR/AcrR family transcriptional regulator [Acidimicrobiia bacterium]|nr:TetR/AcrR family transcriptional regulator [Acidimicrobiia bacterium]
MPRRGVRDPASKERIVEAARRCIAEQGVRGATVRGIAAEAEVSTGYVMHYFPDKGQLEAAVLQANNNVAGARVVRASRRGRGLAALTGAIEALLPLDADRRLEWQVWVAFWTASSADGQGGDGLLGASRVLKGILSVPFAEAIADGELPETLDIDYECERLMTLAVGLGLTAGASSAAGLRRLARRMLDDHIASLAGTMAPAS